MSKSIGTMLALTYLQDDDWNQPTYKDQYGKLWKDINLGDSESPALCSASNNEMDGEADKPLSSPFTIVKSRPAESPYKLEYMILDRMRGTCEYFLGCGNGSLHMLPDNSIDTHIAEMKKLWNGFPAGEKPQWLTWERLLQYEKDMKAYVRAPLRNIKKNEDEK